MSFSSPSIRGFRLALSQPSIVLAEVVWRWTIGIAACFLLTAYLLQYVQTLPVTTVDRLLLASRHPALAMAAIHRIFAGSAFRFTTAGVLLGIALTVGWIFLASVGRLVTLNAVVEASGIEFNGGSNRKTLRSLLALNFLRAATALATIVGIIGAAIAASSFWASTHVAISDAARLWAVLVFSAFIAWSTLNWFLSTAPVFVLANNKSALAAIASAASFCVTHAGPVLAAGSFFELLHLGAFISASGIAFVLFSIVAAFHPGAALFVALLILVLYFSVADFLYIGRLAAYIAIIRGEEPAHAAGSANFPPDSPVPASVDQSEPILSDMPLPAT
jgi:hypothetical protein